MRNLKALIFFAVLTTSLQAPAADWRALFERAGFLGKYAIGASYEWAPEHAVSYLLGNYQIEDEDFYQSNLIYRYSRWNTDFFGHHWRPLQFGFFLVYAMNNQKYFLKSPDKYPYADYYDETALRYGVEFGTTLTFMPSRLGLGYYIRVFDNGVIANFNNSKRDLQYYISSGLSLQYLF
ncbi:hypothetical protein [Bdellovibrio sp.]|uniref:hypothetical protein n=1 Tax=Bdellovibrio sp. TaxID=28201 RepID=UPI0032219433